MSDELKDKNPNSNESGKQVEPTSDYLDAIKGLKQREEDLSKENKQLREDNQRLLNEFINGGVQEGESQQVERTPDEIRKEMNSKRLTNLDFVKDALELREKVMNEGNPDPFVNYGVKTQPTQADIEAANRVAKVLQQCVDSSNGDPDLFTSKLQSEIRG